MLSWSSKRVSGFDAPPPQAASTFPVIPTPSMLSSTQLIICIFISVILYSLFVVVTHQPLISITLLYYCYDNCHYYNFLAFHQPSNNFWTLHQWILRPPLECGIVSQILRFSCEIIKLKWIMWDSCEIPAFQRRPIIQGTIKLCNLWQLASSVESAEHFLGGAIPPSTLSCTPNSNTKVLKDGHLE